MVRVRKNSLATLGNFNYQKVDSQDFQVFPGINEKKESSQAAGCQSGKPDPCVNSPWLYVNRRQIIVNYYSKRKA
jgi:hypothetical protein